MAQDPSNLASFVASHGGDRSLKVEESLGEGYVRLRVAEAERRQAKHDIRWVEDAVIEMLRNARDAGARHIYLASSREGSVRTLTMLDDAAGIPRDMHERVFDARVTSKLDSVRLDRWGVHGRGMALYSIRENALSARVVDSAPQRGSSIQAVFDVGSLQERSDQSSWPTLVMDEEGNRGFRGPRNIIRCCCEFAQEDRACEVYLGSPAEVVATARSNVRLSVEGSALLFIDSLDELPVLERLKLAADASELLQVSASLGLDMSERTAHRILAGQVAPVRSVGAHFRRASRDARFPRKVDLARDRRGLRISPQDMGEFARTMERDFAFLADRYYLNLASEPKVRVSRGRVTVTFEVDEGD